MTPNNGGNTPRARNLSTLIPARHRLAWNSLFVLEHLLGARRVDRLLVHARARVRRNIARSLARHGEGERLPVPEVSDLSPDRFLREFGAPGVPVVFRQRGVSWKACREWSLEFLRDNFGGDRILLPNHKFFGPTEDGPPYRVSNFRDLIDNIESEGYQYARFHPLLDRHPHLIQSLDQSWIQPRLFQKTMGGRVFHVLFVGGRGTKTRVHNAGIENLFLQVQGRKQWSLWPADYICFLEPEANRGPAKSSEFDPLEPDLAKYPGHPHVDCYETVLSPGDILYVPSYVWHHVLNLDNSIGVGTRWTSARNTARHSPLLLALEFFNTNPTLLRTLSSKGEPDFNKLMIESMGHYDYDEEEEAPSDVEH